MYVIEEQIDLENNSAVALATTKAKANAMCEALKKMHPERAYDYGEDIRPDVLEF